ncbi:hypothetical protein PAXRUDRAFT_13143 [Paxillus rubicundulus Ve08.2h10]|uniref:Uncharacterized protein n=1 Tax=Paxillus rubicundulus Ve08.2h10 TaxID=930991 RepID=A0A0D0DZK1_9AGAM|nr:hypothetical protein PAXRUDRAFT_13143 [Paxillus rubicundulus Ve08.2h10]
MSYGLLNGSKEVEGGKGEANERASGSVAPSSNGEYTIPNSIPPPPNLDEHPPPLSMPLKGEESVKDTMCGPNGKIEGEKGGERKAAQEGEWEHSSQLGQQMLYPTRQPPARTPMQDIMASAAAADPTTTNTKSAEPLEPVGALHEPQNGTDSTGSQPPSIGLKGERNRATSPCMEDSEGTLTVKEVKLKGGGQGGHRRSEG